MIRFLKSELLAQGADIVAFGDLTELPSEVREGLPVGVSFGIRIPKHIVRDIADVPTPEYAFYYKTANAKLQEIIKHGERFLRELGYNAVGMTNEQIAQISGENYTKLPLKTVATRAGLGFIGKCALLVTPEFGSAIRLGAILTDTPLEVSATIDESHCGGCNACVEACPGHAPNGKSWKQGVERDVFFDAAVCRVTAYERGVRFASVKSSICGKCIAVCPWTQLYVSSE
jgi:epoxyqueuosine reductase QueG